MGRTTTRFPTAPNETSEAPTTLHRIIFTAAGALSFPSKYGLSFCHRSVPRVTQAALNFSVGSLPQGNEGILLPKSSSCLIC